MVDIDKIIRYEGGDMPGEEEIKFFQELIDSGDCWTLQGHYGRRAKAYIDTGICHLPDKKEKVRGSAKVF